MNTNIIGIKSKGPHIYRVIVGTGTTYDRTFYAYAYDEEDAIDVVADHCEKNGLRGLFMVYGELFQLSAKPTQEERAQIHNLTCCGQNGIFMEIREVCEVDHNLKELEKGVEYMYECTGESFWPKLLATPIKDLDLSDRTFVCLKNDGVFILDDLLNRTYRDLLDINELGKDGADEIVKRLSSIGVCLKEQQ